MESVLLDGRAGVGGAGSAAAPGDLLGSGAKGAAMLDHGVAVLGTPLDPGGYESMKRRMSAWKEFLAVKRPLGWMPDRKHLDLQAPALCPILQLLVSAAL